MDTNGNVAHQKLVSFGHRPEIDGLRAVAVCAVVLFHAKLGCPGGYVGVDIFFVISGFLITTQILSALEASTFSVIDFFERRIRRIAPAMIITVFATIISGWYLYLPDDLDHLGRATVAHVALVSNVFYYRVSGYFGPIAEDLPLLHTWSLAIEEQFYLILPVLLLTVAAIRRQWINPMLAVLCLMSLMLGVWATPKYEAASFFLLPTRAWELLLGAILAAYPGLGRTRTVLEREAISWIGVAAIGTAIFFFDARTEFPGVAAVIPCLGSAAFVWANSPRPTKMGKVLAVRPLQFVGRISYSFYLIHWPLLVFVLHWNPQANWFCKTIVVVIALILATLMWLAIETPVRRKRVLRQRSALLFAVATASIILVASGMMIHLKHGYPSRFDDRTLGYAAAKRDTGYQNELDLRDAESGLIPELAVKSGSMKWLIWGDSHAMSIVPAMESMGRDYGIRVFVATHSSTAPVLGFISKGRYSLKESSPRFSQAVVHYAIEHHVETVIVVAVWSEYASDAAFAICLADTAKTITSAGLRLVIMLDVPEQFGDVPWLLARASVLGRDVKSIGVTLEEHRKKNQHADEVISKVAGANVLILDPTPYFVDTNGLCRAELDGKSLYHDSQHLSSVGALRLKPLFVPLILK